MIQVSWIQIEAILIDLNKLNTDQGYVDWFKWVKQIKTTLIGLNGLKIYLNCEQRRGQKFGIVRNSWQPLTANQVDKETHRMLQKSKTLYTTFWCF